MTDEKNTPNLGTLEKKLKKASEKVQRETATFTDARGKLDAANLDHTGCEEVVDDLVIRCEVAGGIVASASDALRLKREQLAASADRYRELTQKVTELKASKREMDAEQMSLDGGKLKRLEVAATKAQQEYRQANGLAKDLQGKQKQLGYELEAARKKTEGGPKQGTDKAEINGLSRAEEDAEREDHGLSEAQKSKQKAAGAQTKAGKVVEVAQAARTKAQEEHALIQQQYQEAMEEAELREHEEAARAAAELADAEAKAEAEKLKEALENQ